MTVLISIRVQHTVTVLIFLKYISDDFPSIVVYDSNSMMSKKVNLTNLFFEHPILNSPYTYPAKHWELDSQGPGVNHLGTYGRWAFAEFTEVFEIESEFNKMIERVVISSTRLIK
jgi:hypothetical protein